MKDGHISESYESSYAASIPSGQAGVSRSLPGGLRVGFCHVSSIALNRPFLSLLFAEIRMTSEITVESGEILVFTVTLLFDGSPDILPACGDNVKVSEFLIHVEIHLLAKLETLIPEGGKVAGVFVQDIYHYEWHIIFVEESEKMSHPQIAI